MPDPGVYDALITALLKDAVTSDADALIPGLALPSNPPRPTNAANPKLCE